MLDPLANILRLLEVSGERTQLQPGRHRDKLLDHIFLWWLGCLQRQELGVV